MEKTTVKGQTYAVVAKADTTLTAPDGMSLELKAGIQQHFTAQSTSVSANADFHLTATFNSAPIALGNGGSAGMSEEEVMGILYGGETVTAVTSADYPAHETKTLADYMAIGFADKVTGGGVLKKIEILCGGKTEYATFAATPHFLEVTCVGETFSWTQEFAAYVADGNYCCDVGIEIPAEDFTLTVKSSIEGGTYLPTEITGGGSTLVYGLEKEDGQLLWIAGYGYPASKKTGVVLPYQLTWETAGEVGSLLEHAADAVVHITDEERAAWNAKQKILTFDASPTANSANPVTSGGVYTALQGVGLTTTQQNALDMFNFGSGSSGSWTFGICNKSTYSGGVAIGNYGEPKQAGEIVLSTGCELGSVMFISRMRMSSGSITFEFLNGLGSCYKVSISAANFVAMLESAGGTVETWSDSSGLYDEIP